MSAQVKYYNTGGGALYFTPMINDILGAEVPFGQTEDVKFSSEIETLAHDSTEEAIAVEDMNILKKITGKLAIDTIEISPDMLGKAFLGDKYETPVIANAIGATPSLGYVTATVLDTAYPIGVKHLDTATIIVQDDTDTVTYVLDTDYTISTIGYETSITALTTGSIIAGEVLHITADNDGYNDIRIEAFMQTKLEGKLRFVGTSATGLNYTYTFHKVSLLSSGDFSLKSSEEFTKVSFEGSMLASPLITASNESKLFKIESSELT